MSDSKKSKIWSLSFFPILLTYFIDNFGQGVVYPIFAALLLKPQFHLLSTDVPFLHKTLILGALTASFPLARIFGAPILGRLSDRIGRKRIFTTTILGGIAGYLLTALGVHRHELLTIWTGRIITGFFAGNLTLCLAAIADITPTKVERVKNFGWVGTIGSLGFVFAILAGAALSNSEVEAFFHPSVPFLLTAALSCINFVMISLFFKESHLVDSSEKLKFFKGMKSLMGSIKRSGITTLYVVYFLFILTWSTSIQYISTYLVKTFNVTSEMIPYTFLLLALIWSITNFFLNPLLAKLFSPMKTLLFSLLFLAIFLSLVLIPNQPISLFLTFFSFAALCAAICWTNGLAALSLKAPNSIQGAILGLNQSIVALAFIVGPLIGSIIAGINIHQLYILTASFSLLAAILLIKPAYRSN